MATGHLAVAWMFVQIVETLLPMFGVPESVARTIVIGVAIGLIPVVALTWIFEWTPEGLVDDRRPSEHKQGQPPDMREKIKFDFTPPN